MCYSILMNNPSTPYYSPFHNPTPLPHLICLEEFAGKKKRNVLAFTQPKRYPKTLSVWTFPNYSCGVLHGEKVLISWARPFRFIKVNAITLNPTQETTGNCCGLWHSGVKCSLPLISGIGYAFKFPQVEHIAIVWSQTYMDKQKRIHALNKRLCSHEKTETEMPFSAQTLLGIQGAIT